MNVKAGNNKSWRARNIHRTRRHWFHFSGPLSLQSLHSTTRILSLLPESEHSMGNYRVRHHLAFWNRQLLICLFQNAFISTWAGKSQVTHEAKLARTELPSFCDTGYCDKTLIVTVFSSNIMSTTPWNHRILWQSVIVTLLGGPNTITISGKHCTVKH